MAQEKDNALALAVLEAPQTNTQEQISELANAALEKLVGEPYEDLKRKADSIEVADHTDKKAMREAATLRKRIRQTRLSVRKVVTAAKEDAHKRHKVLVNIEKTFEENLKSIEADLKHKEETLDRYKEKQRELRGKERADYSTVHGYRMLPERKLKEMSEEQWEQYCEEEEARIAEQKRIEQERKEAELLRKQVAKEQQRIEQERQQIEQERAALERQKAELANEVKPSGHSSEPEIQQQIEVENAQQQRVSPPQELAPDTPMPETKQAVEKPDVGSILERDYAIFEYVGQRIDNCLTEVKQQLSRISSENGKQNAAEVIKTQTDTKAKVQQILGSLNRQMDNLAQE